MLIEQMPVNVAGQMHASDIFWGWQERHMGHKQEKEGQNEPQLQSILASYAALCLILYVHVLAVYP